MMAIGVIIYVSCRKTETREGIIKPDELVAKFFESHSPSDPLVLRINDLLKRENKKYGLVERITSKIGFPYWDKAKTIQKSIARGGERYEHYNDTIFKTFRKLY